MIYQSKQPLIKHLVNSIRDISIDAERMRSYVGDIALYLFYEALTDQKMSKKKIPTWIGELEFDFIEQEYFVFIPILRAGVPMMETLARLFPQSSVGYLAMKRDEETFEPIVFYKRLPNLQGKTAVILDPMVATGGSLHDAITLVKEENPAKIISLNIVGVQEGLEHAQNADTSADIYIAQIDERLNEQKYIIPGLGDAGDREYNT